MSRHGLKRRLLAGTCLTLAGAAGAHAGVINETTDFPNNAPGTLLPVDTTKVTGSVSCFGDCDDWFEFQGLTPGTQFSVTGSLTWLGFVRAVDTNSTFLGGFGSEEGLTSMSFLVPADGRVLLNVNTSPPLPNLFEEGSSGPAPVTNYSLDITSTADVPEPATLAPAALALAGALAWRRRRS